MPTLPCSGYLNSTSSGMPATLGTEVLLAGKEHVLCVCVGLCQSSFQVSGVDFTNKSH